MMHSKQSSAMNEMGPQADKMRWMLSSVDIGCQLKALGTLVVKDLTLSADIGALNCRCYLSPKGALI